MSPQARRPVFELLRLTASPIGDALSIVDVEGRFGQSGRFARRPTLVVERSGDGERLELAPVHLDARGEHWRAAYAVPADALDDARLALAVRGALYELPEPTPLGGSAGARDRSVRLAREANGLRRQIEHLEAQVEEAGARVDAAEQRAEAAEERARAADERIAVLEAAVRELEQRVLTAAGEVEDAARRAEVARERARRAEDAAQAAQDRAEAEAAGVEVLREELAEERRRAGAAVRELQQRLDEARAEAVAELDQAPHADVEDEDLAEDDEDDEDDEDEDVTRPRRPRPAPPVVERRPIHPVAHHHTPGPERWLAVIAILLLVAIVIALIAGLRG